MIDTFVFLLSVLCMGYCLALMSILSAGLGFSVVCLGKIFKKKAFFKIFVINLKNTARFLPSLGLKLSLGSVLDDSIKTKLRFSSSRKIKKRSAYSYMNLD